MARYRSDSLKVHEFRYYFEDLEQRFGELDHCVKDVFFSYIKWFNEFELHIKSFTGRYITTCKMLEQPTRLREKYERFYDSYQNTREIINNMNSDSYRARRITIEELVFITKVLKKEIIINNEILHLLGLLKKNKVIKCEEIEHFEYVGYKINGIYHHNLQLLNRMETLFERI